jgi:hypothetical protein
MKDCVKRAKEDKKENSSGMKLQRGMGTV